MRYCPLFGVYFHKSSLILDFTFYLWIDYPWCWNCPGSIKMFFTEFSNFIVYIMHWARVMCESTLDKFAYNWAQDIAVYPYQLNKTWGSVNCSWPSHFSDHSNWLLNLHNKLFSQHAWEQKFLLFLQLVLLEEFTLEPVNCISKLGMIVSRNASSRYLFSWCPIT